MDKLLSCCKLCPRKCGADRTSGNLGLCHTSGELIVARASLHFWEEPCISGERGSGTVFFSGCPLGCIYCQNHNIKTAKAGKSISIERLGDIFLELEQKGAHNINLVTGTHYTLHIIKALEYAKTRGLSLPIVYNTSGYELTETLKMLDGLIDIYLPDFKYISDKTASKYSQAANYPKIAKEALSEMFRQVGKSSFSDDDMMQTGMIVRHLVLPEHKKESKQILKYLYDTFGDDIYISIMNQYTPVTAVKNHPELSRKVRDDEYDDVIDFAVSLGITNAFVQEGEAASESFIPEFDCEGV